jgi:amino acid adenylation domain-containing protein
MLSDAQRALVAARLRRGRAETPAGIPRRGPDAGELPLSFGQEQLWFLDRFTPGLSTYNVPCALRLRGPLDAAALNRALDALAARHEALRTRFVTNERGLPIQQVAEPEPVRPTAVDLSALTAQERRTRLLAVTAEETARPFDLSRGSLLRVLLVRLAEDEHILFAVVHHIVFDGWSAGVFQRELAALYAEQVDAGPPALEPLPIQFADFALWERERLRGAALDGLIEYWRTTMDGFQTLNLPTDRPRQAVADQSGGVERLNLGAEAWAAVRDLGTREGATPAVVLLAALNALLHRYTGQDDIVVGTISANRGRPELAALIGFLVTTLPIRTDLSGDPAFADLLARVREATSGAYGHQDLSFGRLVEELRVERDPSRAPVFQTLFTHVEEGEAAPARGGGVEFGPADGLADPDTAKFDLALVTEVRAGELWVEAAYASALFDRATIRRLLTHFGTLLRGATADAPLQLSQLPLLTADELHQELTQWNDTAHEPWSGCVHEHFEAQAARTPDAVAAELDGADPTTYAQLNAQANRIARWLRDAGAGPQALVGVSMAASPRRLAVLLGIMKAGGGYVPLDPALPAERLAFMMRDAAMPVVVADAASAAHLPDTGARVLSIDAEEARIARFDGADPGFPADPAAAAYVIYTSGSTGRPKGVVVEHRSVVNFALGQIETWGLGPADAAIQFASLNFDVSVFDMFTALLCGARVVLGSRETLLSPPRLAALMRERAVTYGCLPPAMAGLLIGEQFPGLRILLVAGEEMPAHLVTGLLRPGLRLGNAYGPTEDTVLATIAELDGTVLPPPIGLPVVNTQAYVLDARLNPVPVGVIGELHLGGSGLARGYLNAPELTGQRFVRNPFDDRPGARLYKTGDMVRRLLDGDIVFVGRTDGQIKIRGLRVELGEIETALLSHPAVAQSVVVVAADHAGDKQLVGYLRPEPGTGAPDLDRLRQYLAERLPGYMVPAHLVPLDSFPVNPSGKIDKAALPAVDAPVGDTRHTAPRTLVETALVDMYAELLGREQVGVDEGFFDLGGNSLRAMQLITMLHNDLVVDIDVTDVFLAPTPGQLTVVLRDKYGLDDAELDGAAFEGLSDEETAALLSSIQ